MYLILYCVLHGNLRVMNRYFVCFLGLKREPNTVDEGRLMRRQMLTTSMNVMPNSTRNWNASMANILQKSSKIWREELQCSLFNYVLSLPVGWPVRMLAALKKKTQKNWISTR